MTYNSSFVQLALTSFAEEWLLDDHRCLLDEVKENCQITVVDIEQYLLKGQEEKRFIEQMFPDDPNIMKALLQEVNILTVIIKFL